MNLSKTTLNKLREPGSITIKEINYKFRNKTFILNEIGDYFTIDIIRFIDKDTNKIIIETLLKTLICNIKGKEFTYRNLREDKIFREYLRYIDNINFVNSVSSRLNNKKWFNYENEFEGGDPPLKFFFK